MDQYDVIVVGGGVSGLLAALTLSKHGKKVLVLEKEDHVGGNCNSYLVDGFQVDTGPHAITHLEEGPLKRLMDNYFDYLPVFEDYGHYYVRTEDRFMKIPSTIREFATFEIFPRRDRLAITQTITKALTFSAFGMDLSAQSVYDYLPETLSKDTYDFANAISFFLSGRSMYETSAQRVLAGSSFVRDTVTQEHFENLIDQNEPVIRTESILESVLSTNLHTSLRTRIDSVAHPFTSLSRLATNRVGISQAYPRRGLKSVLNTILYSLPSSVEIKTRCPVKRIIEKDGKAVGVEADEIYHSDMVVYTGFATSLPDMVGDLPSPYLDMLAGIDHTKSLTIWLGIDDVMEEFNYTGSEIWFKDTPYWAMPISNYDASLAPDGKQLVGFAFVIDEQDKDDRAIKNAYQTIYRAHPDLEGHVEMKHEQILVPEKAAVTIDGKFADIRTPINSLYVVGTDTDRRSMGITRAAYSVIELLRVLSEDNRLY
ncbi:MAG: NAD(P)/FAD-dependent oxidoreductase [Methanosarcinaceae archaeon]|nr:NAD(P)/FAD-dependent oxidoreductase [Methanosarcinaceae archaeon]